SSLENIDYGNRCHCVCSLRIQLLRTTAVMPAIDARFYQTRWGVVALATLCCLLWGSAYPAIKNGYALLSIAPGDIASQVLFAGWRFVLAGAILLVVGAALRKPVFALTLRQARQVAQLGLTQTAVQYVFFY